MSASRTTDTPHRNGFERSGILAALRQLIGALDSRTPQTERPGEIRIASDAQQLRRAAVARIEELTGAGSSVNLYDQALVEAIMTDDGGPQPERGSDIRAHRGRGVRPVAT